MKIRLRIVPEKSSNFVIFFNKVSERKSQHTVNQIILTIQNKGSNYF